MGLTDWFKGTSGEANAQAAEDGRAQAANSAPPPQDSDSAEKKVSDSPFSPDRLRDPAQLAALQALLNPGKRKQQETPPASDNAREESPAKAPEQVSSTPKSPSASASSILEGSLRAPEKLAELDRLLGKRNEAGKTPAPREQPLAKATGGGDEPPPTDSIWQFYLEPVVQSIQQRTRDNALLPIFLLENPYPVYAEQIREALGDLVTKALPGYIVIEIDKKSEGSLARLVTGLADHSKRPSGAVLFCTSRGALPRQFRSVVREDGYMTIPALTFERIHEFAQRRRPGVSLSEAARDWVKWIGPQELIIADTLSDAHWEQGLIQLARQRAGAQVVGKPRRLDELFGIDAARGWAQQLFNDLALAREGKISWREVDCGALLAGAPGTGKTTLAKAIASEAGTNFVAVSPVKDWMSGNGLDDCINLMSATFSQARQQAPTIMFIDEIDSIGNRENFTGHNASWNTAFLDALLTELDGFDERERVVVIGATNFSENVDNALRRAGRLDRTIRLQRPDAVALAAMYRHVLSAYPNQLGSDEAALRECASSSLGLTGADVEVIVRGARRRARLDGNRPIAKTDVLKEIYRIPPDAERRPLSADALRVTAWHEAGHALVGLKLPTLRDKIGIASIIPDNEGALGFVAIVPDEANETRDSLQDRICMALAGRAAEQLLLPAGEVTTGAGGASAGNDLALARRLAEAFIGLYGFSEHYPNWWTDGNVDEETQAVVTAQHQRATRLLTEHRETLEKLAGVLREEFVIGRDRLAELAGGAL